MPDERSEDEIRRDNIAKISAMIYNDPATRPKFEAIIKEKFPNAEIPGLAAREAAAAANHEAASLRETNKRLTAHLTRLENDQAWKPVLDAGVVTASEIPEVQKLMAEKLVGDPMLAAQEWRRRKAESTGTPRTGPAAVQIAGIHDQSTEFFKALGQAAASNSPQEVDRVARVEAYRVFNELATAGRAGG